MQCGEISEPQRCIQHGCGSVTSHITTMQNASISIADISESDKVRFWKYVDKKSDQECWEWIGGRDRKNYGRVRLGKKNVFSHRISFFIHHGAIPIGHQVMHKCDNPS